MKLIIDCDPGHDDAIAILYAARYLDVVGITTIFGNQTVEKTTLNALRVLTLAGVDIPVAKGCAEPLVGDAPLAPDTHGASGLDGVELPEPAASPVDMHAVRFLIETASKHRGDVAIAITGAHTNVALALRLEPRLRDWVTSISVMGGTVGVGNLRPQACVNILSDPEAAHIVFESGIPIRWIGYETTRTVLMKTDDIARLRAASRPVASAVADIATYYLERQLAVNGINGAPMHDSCAIAPFVAPELIRYEPAHLAVALDSGIARGMTVVDRRPLRPGTALSSVVPKKPDNILMAVEVDRAAVIGGIVEAVSSYSRAEMPS
jgi:inosine-uridine nucleoside N-ribohydrolase